MSQPDDKWFMEMFAAGYFIGETKESALRKYAFAPMPIRVFGDNEWRTIWSWRAKQNQLCWITGEEYFG